MMSFGAADGEGNDSDGAMSSAVSVSDDWSSHCTENHESSPPVEEELKRIFTEVVQGLWLEWSPPTNNQRRTVWICVFCRRVVQLTHPRGPRPFS